jgi:hypothetical protein
MTLDAIALKTTPRRLAARAPWRPGPPDPDILDCPGCGGPLAMAAAGPDDPDRSIGTCPARQCREGAVIFRRLEGRLIRPIGSAGNPDRHRGRVDRTGRINQRLIQMSTNKGRQDLGGSASRRRALVS